MKHLGPFLGALLLLVSLSGQAQINDCSGAVVVCTSEPIGFNPIGPGYDDFADPDNLPGCITALEQNSAWYYFEIDPNAPPSQVLGFTISPLGGFGEDYDWALFGPDVECGDLGGPIRCSSSSAQCGFCPETGMGMGTTDVTEGPGTGDGFVSTLIVQPGQGFYLLVDNWQGSNQGFILSWTGTAAQYLNCEASPPCALYAVAGQDIFACEGGTFTLNGGSTGSHGMETYSWTGTNGGTGYLSDPTSPTPTVELPPGFTGTIVFTLTVVEDTCSGEDQVEVLVNPLPEVEINPIGPFCANDDPYTLTATPTGGVWGGAATGNNFNPTLLGPGIHTVTYTYADNNDCEATAYLDIEVFALPEIAVDPDPAEFCDSEGSLELTAVPDGTGPFSYAWTTPTGPGSENTYDATVSGLHTVSVTDGNGCVNSVDVMVVSHINPEVDILDPGPICETLPSFTMTATPAGGFWDGSNIDPSGELYPVMIGPDTFPVTYTFVDNFGCEGSGSIDVIIIPTPAAVPDNNGPVCEGQPIQLTGDTDGTGTVITYSWTGPNGYSSAQQNPADATAGGTYILVVTVDGCPSQPATTIVSTIDAPEAMAANGGPYCAGGPIQLFGSTNATGGTITYNWSGPGGYTSTAQNPTDATEAGLYSLIVTNGTCPSVPATTDVVFSAMPDAAASNSGPSCAGQPVMLSGTTTAGGTSISYQWTGPNGYQSSVQNPTDVTASGIYQLIVNVDGCPSGPAITEVILHPLPQPVMAGQDTFCIGFSTILDVGAGFAAYQWSDGSQAQTLTVSGSGTYAVTVTDGNGCSGSTSLMVTELSALVPVVNGPLSFCAGSGTTLDAGSGFTGYLWSSGATTQTININTGGPVSVTVTDASGCTGTAVVNVTATPLPLPVISGSATYCIGGYTILDAGTGYAAYAWSNDSITQAIVVNAPGIYSVDVTDLNGCTGSASVTVVESTSLSPVINGPTAFCAGGSTTLDAGAGFASYLWSDGSVTQTLSITAAGTYAVTVSDGRGCSGTDTVTIAEEQPPVATLQPTATVCNTTAGGSVINFYTLILAGDMSGSWTDADNSGASGPFTALDFNGVAAGTYRFIYRTNSAVPPCVEATYEVLLTVRECACPDVVFGPAGPLCNESALLDMTIVQQTQFPGNWSILQVPTGANPATLMGSIFTATNSDPGDYILQFTLLSPPPPGCPSGYPLTVHVDDAVDAGAVLAPLRYCAGADDVVPLAALLSGEDPGGSWAETSAVPSSGGAFNAVTGTFSLSSQLPGTYAFQYTLPVSGVCPSKSAEVSVILSALPVVMIATPDVLDCANPQLRLDASGSSFGPGYVIAWAGPGVVNDGNERTLRPTIDQAGTYQLIITHEASGCVAVASVTVTAMTDPPTGAVLTVLDPSCFGTSDGLISVAAVSGGTPPYSYSLDGKPLVGIGTFEPLSAGDHTLLLEDANGCRWDTMVTLLAPAAIGIELGPDLEVGLGESAVVQATILLPAGQVDTILWSPANVITCLDPGCLVVSVHAPNTLTLQATLVDDNGCTVSDRLLIILNKDRRVFIPNVFSPNGDGINDRFFVTGDPTQVTRIKTLAIFDRWGQTVYATADAALNDPTVFWDGRFRDAPLGPAVFVFYAEIEFIDGVVEAYRGNVTLLR